MPDEPAQVPRATTGEPPGSDWAAYYRSTIGRDPRPLFSKGVAAVDAASIVPGQAIEIGFGDGRETLALLDAGWRVLAIDPTPAAAKVLQSQVPPEVADRFRSALYRPRTPTCRHSTCSTRGTPSRSWVRMRSTGSGTQPETGSVLVASSSSTSSATQFMGRTGGYAIHRCRSRATACRRARAPRARRGGPGREFVPRPEALARLRRHRPATASPNG